jgi:sortase A
LFLQYNRVLFANVEAYVSPGNVDPANIIVDPTTVIAVSPEPKLIIPKINVDVPVDYNTTPDYNAQMKAMENGVAWFGIPGANSKPGQIGNTVLSGHSSNDLIDSGSYKFVFARLDHIDKGDTIYVNFNSTRYTYTVTKKEVVKPTEVSKLVYATDKPVLTLITCTPLGTALNRLLVTAEQVSPSPTQATAAPETNTSDNQSVSIPGNSPTFLQRIFGGGNS